MENNKDLLDLCRLNVMEERFEKCGPARTKEESDHRQCVGRKKAELVTKMDSLLATMDSSSAAKAPRCNPCTSCHYWDLEEEDDPHCGKTGHAVWDKSLGCPEWKAREEE